jgi:hypothetical protein
VLRALCALQEQQSREVQLRADLELQKLSLEQAQRDLNENLDKYAEEVSARLRASFFALQAKENCPAECLEACGQCALLSVQSRVGMGCALLCCAC